MASSSIAFGLFQTRKTYAGANRFALDATTVSIPANACIAILGTSGAGKSTLMNLLGLLDFPDPPQANAAERPYLIYSDGERCCNYYADGKFAGAENLDSETKRDRLRREHFGFVFQQGHLLDHLSCGDNVALALAMSGVPAADYRGHLAGLLEQHQLTKKTTDKARQTSGGERQRLAVLRALAHGPRVVFADEPTSHLDPDSRKRVEEHLLHWQSSGTPERPHTLLLVTHDFSLAYRLCDYFLLMDEGRLVGGLLARDGVVDPPVPIARRVSSEDDLSRILREARSNAPPTAAEEPGADGQRPPEMNDEPLPAGDGLPLLSVNRRGKPTLAYLAWLARKDTFRREDLLLTFNGTAILALMAVMCIVGLGLVTGKERLMSRELNSPLACKLDVTFVRSESMIDDATVEQLKRLELVDGRGVQPKTGQMQPQRLVFNDAKGHIKRWNTTQQLFWQGNQTNLKSNYCDGRTADPGDPVLGAIEYVPGREFTGFDDPGGRQIIATPELLQACALPANAKQVTLAYKGTTPIALEVVGVAKGLRGPKFIIPESFYQAIQMEAIQPDPTVACVWLKCHSAEQCAAVAASLQKHLPAYLESQPEGHRVRLQVARGGRKRLSDIKADVDYCLTAIADDVACSAEDITLQIPPADLDQRAPQHTYAFCSLYVDGIDQLEPAAEAVESLVGLKVIDYRYLDMVRRLRNTLGPLRLMMQGVVILALFIAVFNTGISMWQRIRRKRSDTAVLKACGMTSWQLILVFSIEGVILGCIAVALSLGLSYLVGHTLALYVADSQDFSSFAARASTAAGDETVSSESSIPGQTAEPADVSRCIEPGNARWWTRRLPRYLMGRVPQPAARLLYQNEARHQLLISGALLLICIASCLVATYRSASEAPAQAIRD